MKHLTVAAQHTLSSYRWSCVRFLSSNQVGLPKGDAGAGKEAARSILLDQWSGVSMSRRRSPRLGDVFGTLIVSGAWKMTFSVFAPAKLEKMAMERPCCRERRM